MIVLDPDLDPDPGSRTNAIAPLGVRRRSLLPWQIRIPSKSTLARFLGEAQQAVSLSGEVTVLLTTDAVLRRLNRRFRSKNEATDVLSFPADSIPGLARSEQPAGDLAISIDTARKQAAEQGHALTCELKILILHGLLHLAGYDHEKDSGSMARRERTLRAKLALPLGLIERTTEPAKVAPVSRPAVARVSSPAPSTKRRRP